MLKAILKTYSVYLLMIAGITTGPKLNLILSIFAIYLISLLAVTLGTWIIPCLPIHQTYTGVSTESHNWLYQTILILGL